MLQNIRVTAFTVSELLRENQQGEGIKLPPNQIRVNTISVSFSKSTWTYMKICIIQRLLVTKKQALRSHCYKYSIITISILLINNLSLYESE